MRTLKRTAALFLTVLWAALCSLCSYAAADNVVWAASITYEYQNTQLSDRVYEAVQKLHESDANQFCRVVIISDGVDDKQIGYTHTELENLLRSCGYPIYTVGCGSNDTEARRTRLENLFALSRVNRGQSFYLGDTKDTFAIAKGICEYNTAQQVVVNFLP